MCTAGDTREFPQCPLSCTEPGGDCIEALLWPWGKVYDIPAHWALLKVCGGWIPLGKPLEQAGKAEYVVAHHQPVQKNYKSTSLWWLWWRPTDRD